MSESKMNGGELAEYTASAEFCMTSSYISAVKWQYECLREKVYGFLEPTILRPASRQNTTTSTGWYKFPSFTSVSSDAAECDRQCYIPSIPQIILKSLLFRGGRFEFDSFPRKLDFVSPLLLRRLDGDGDLACCPIALV